MFAVMTFVGIGVDYGIHLVHRCAHGAVDDRAEAVAHLGPVILVAALTTLFGFGTLVTSSYPPLRLLGVVSTVAIVALGAASLFVLPALLLKRAAHDRRRRPLRVVAVIAAFNEGPHIARGRARHAAARRRGGRRRRRIDRRHGGRGGARPAPRWSGIRTTAARASRCAAGWRRSAAAASRHVLLMDGDLQHRPADVPRLIAAAAVARRGADVWIVGARSFDRAQMPALALLVQRDRELGARRPGRASRSGTRSPASG